MPLIKEVLVAQLTSILSETTSGGQPVSASAKAQQLADAIDAYIRTATVSVTVTGTTACGAGPGAIAVASGIGTIT